MKKLASIALFCLLIGGCAFNKDVTQPQKEAGFRSLGRAIFVIASADPEIAVASAKYCQKYHDVQDAVEAQELIQIGIDYLLKHASVDNEALVAAVKDLMVALGVSDEAITQAFETEGAIRIPEILPEMLDNLRLVVDGYCAMVG